MTQLMPELLSTWSWRLDRVRNGRTVLTRGQAVTARTDLVHDRTAHPEAYVGYDSEFAAAVDALDLLAQQGNRGDDLRAVLSAERRRAGQEPRDRSLAHAPEARARASLADEHDGVPSGLPVLLDQWVHRLIRYRRGAKIITSLEAARAEIHLGNEADLHPGAYRNAVAGPLYRHVMRELGEIATAQRSGPPVAGRGLRRGIAGAL